MGLVVINGQKYWYDDATGQYYYIDADGNPIIPDPVTLGGNTGHQGNHGNTGNGNSGTGIVAKEGTCKDAKITGDGEDAKDIPRSDGGSGGGGGFGDNVSGENIIHGTQIGDRPGYAIAGDGGSVGATYEGTGNGSTTTWDGGLGAEGDIRGGGGGGITISEGAGSAGYGDGGSGTTSENTFTGDVTDSYGSHGGVRLGDGVPVKCNPFGILGKFPTAKFTYRECYKNRVQFINLSTQAQHYYWSFGTTIAENSYEIPADQLTDEALIKALSEYSNSNSEYSPIRKDPTIDYSLLGGIYGIGSVYVTLTAFRIETDTSPFSANKGNAIVIRSSCTVPVFLHNYEYIVDFEYSSSHLSASFFNLSTGCDHTFKWSFGDGSHSSELSPKHTYSVAGVYHVTLMDMNTAQTKTSIIAISTLDMPAPSYYDNLEVTDIEANTTPISINVDGYGNIFIGYNHGETQDGMALYQLEDGFPSYVRKGTYSTVSAEASCGIFLNGQNYTDVLFDNGIESAYLNICGKVIAPMRRGSTSYAVDENKMQIVPPGNPKLCYTGITISQNPNIMRVIFAASPNTNDIFMYRAFDLSATREMVDGVGGKFGLVDRPYSILAIANPKDGYDHILVVHGDLLSSGEQKHSVTIYDTSQTDYEGNFVSYESAFDTALFKLAWDGDILYGLGGNQYGTGENTSGHETIYLMSYDFDLHKVTLGSIISSGDGVTFSSVNSIAADKQFIYIVDSVEKNIKMFLRPGSESSSINASFEYQPAIPTVYANPLFANLEQMANEKSWIARTRNFKSTSTGSRLRYKWDFGCGQSSIEDHAQVTFPATGTYTVTLTVSNKYGESSYSKEIVLTPYNSGTIGEYHSVGGDTPKQDLISFNIIDRPGGDSIVANHSGVIDKAVGWFDHADDPSMKLEGVTDFAVPGQSKLIRKTETRT